jgi:hypothetical protein
MTDNLEQGVLETIARLICAAAIERALPDQPAGVRAKLIDADWRTYLPEAKPIRDAAVRDWERKQAAKKAKEERERKERAERKAA